ncbi:hypothetical protein SLE2022_345640 [Rubroshorea leprosula]
MHQTPQNLSYLPLSLTETTIKFHQLRHQVKNEGNIHCSLHTASATSLGSSSGFNSSDMQPDTTKLMCERDNIITATIPALLQQDQGTEALPLPVRKEP